MVLQCAHTGSSRPGREIDAAVKALQQRRAEADVPSIGLCCTATFRANLHPANMIAFAVRRLRIKQREPVKPHSPVPPGFPTAIWPATVARS